MDERFLVPAICVIFVRVLRYGEVRGRVVRLEGRRFFSGVSEV